MLSTGPKLVEAMQGELGEDLRLVGHYTPEDLDVLFVRDDVAGERDLDTLHNHITAENREHGSLEERIEAGSLRARLAHFDQLHVANFLGEDLQGHVVTLEAEAQLQLDRFLETYSITTGVVRRFERIQFSHPPGEEPCPRCRSQQTISTPEAGPGSPYYCMNCDKSFT